MDETAQPEVAPIASLVRRAIDGDRNAFATLFERYAPMVHGILLSRVPYEEVEDLLQDVFLRAFRNVSTLADPLAFGGWLAAIARNRSADWHRRRAPSDTLPDDLPAQAAPTAEAREALRALRDLPETYREALTLRLVEGLSGPEIAELCGMTHGSVRVHLHRGMKLLRRRLTGTPEDSHDP